MFILVYSHDSFFQHMEWGRTPMVTSRLKDPKQSLVRFMFRQVSPKSPELKTRYDSVVQMAEIDMASVEVRLEQNALLSLLAFVTHIGVDLGQNKIPSTTAATTVDKKRKDLKKNLNRNVGGKETYFFSFGKF